MTSAIEHKHEHKSKNNNIDKNDGKLVASTTATTKLEFKHGT